MNVSLTPELEQLVHDKVESGMYSTASEVVREALRLLCQRDELRQTQLEQLRRDINIGLEAVKRGEVVEAKDAFRHLWQRQSELERQD